MRTRTLLEACKLHGFPVSYRQLDYWHTQWHGRTGSSGTRRDWTREDIRRALVASVHHEWSFDVEVRDGSTVDEFSPVEFVTVHLRRLNNLVDRIVETADYLEGR